MEDVLSKILDNIQTIDELYNENENDNIDPIDPIQIAIDSLWEYVKYEKNKLYLESLWEIK